MEHSELPGTFEALAASRREWIESVLRPWCLSASRAELLKANAEWMDIAGKVDSIATLWTWAWERFPELTHPDMPGVNETHEVSVTLTDGSMQSGFPDSRNTQQGRLVLIQRDPITGASISTRPISIDDVLKVEGCASC